MAAVFFDFLFDFLPLREVVGEIEVADFVLVLLWTICDLLAGYLADESVRVIPLPLWEV